MLGTPIPAVFLPCVDDWAKLRVIADLLEEQGNPDLAKQCRWTANEWQANRGLRRKDVQEGMEVWARYSNQGWTAGYVARVTPQRIVLDFPRRRWGHNGTRAWWDLEPRNRWNGHQWEKPKPRKGYGTGKNTALASMLCGKRFTMSDKPLGDTGEQDMQPGLFEEERIFSNCNVCGRPMADDDEHGMGMCSRCAWE